MVHFLWNVLFLSISAVGENAKICPSQLEQGQFKACEMPAFRVKTDQPARTAFAKNLVDAAKFMNKLRPEKIKNLVFKKVGIPKALEGIVTQFAQAKKSGMYVVHDHLIVYIDKMTVLTDDLKNILRQFSDLYYGRKSHAFSVQPNKVNNSNVRKIDTDLFISEQGHPYFVAQYLNEANAQQIDDWLAFGRLESGLASEHDGHGRWKKYFEQASSLNETSLGSVLSDQKFDKSAPHMKKLYGAGGASAFVERLTFLKEGKRCNNCERCRGCEKCEKCKDFQKCERSGKCEKFERCGTWVVYATHQDLSAGQLPKDPLQAQKDNDVIIFVSYTTHPEAVFVAPMGISRTVGSFYHDRQYSGISMNLHAFAAKVMNLVYPKQSCLVVTPTVPMAQIFLKAPPEVSVYVGTKLPTQEEFINAGISKYDEQGILNEIQERKKKLNAKNIKEQMSLRDIKDLQTKKERNDSSITEEEWLSSPEVRKHAYELYMQSLRKDLIFHEDGTTINEQSTRLRLKDKQQAEQWEKRQEIYKNERKNFPNNPPRLLRLGKHITLYDAQDKEIAKFDRDDPIYGWYFSIITPNDWFVIDTQPLANTYHREECVWLKKGV